MDADRLRACLAALHWSQRGLAEILSTNERQVRRWAAGATIPPAVAAWLETAAAWHEAHRRRGGMERARRPLNG